ncbi:hypothetical protein ACM0P6_02645 [Komagataeibacter sucrofermentans]|uniref:hypothetical protein n=1 Tax=Komagataeibacter sucrofermentans TaxID=1053551 RepID=UPI00142E8184|nr:hypothetical protein [Komagataeibacter sucrofermentans]
MHSAWACFPILAGVAFTVLSLAHRAPRRPAAPALPACLSGRGAWSGAKTGIWHVALR